MYTTAEMLAVQERVMTRFAHGRYASASLVSSGHRWRALDEHAYLSDEQHDLVQVGGAPAGTASRRPSGEPVPARPPASLPPRRPRTFFDNHRNRSGRREVGIDHAYALTSYAVQGSTHDVSTSRVDATATRAETYVDITSACANHLYLTAATDPLDGEALPRLPPAPASPAVADRLHCSTGELTAWELRTARPTLPAEP